MDTKINSHRNKTPKASPWLSYSLIGIAIAYICIFILLPLLCIFAEAFKEGYRVYFASFLDPDAISAIKLTLFVTIIVVPINMLFGLAAAWAITKYDFRFKSILLSLIDLPFAVSPVVSGLIYILLFGAGGWFYPYLEAANIKIVFATPAIVLVTLFVTSPLVAREIIPLMQSQSSDEELAALTLGASGWQIFWRVTLPNIKWALFYGVVLCNARAMGEFGAVAVVSGSIRGETNTMPLYIEILYNEYHSAAAFSIASALALIALVTLVIKSVIEWNQRRILTQAEE